MGYLLALALSLATPCGEARGPKAQVAEITKLGFRVEESKGGSLTVYRDRRTGARLEARYNAVGRLESLEEYNAAGMLLDRRSFESGRFVHEEYLPRGGRRVSETFADGRFESRVVEIELQDGRLRRRLERRSDPSGRDRAEVVCPRELGLPEVDATLADFRQVHTMLPGDADGFILYVGNRGQTRFKTEGCESYRMGKGEHQLASDMEQAINIGTSCMAGRGPAGDLGPRARMEAARMVAYLSSNQEGKLQCMAETRPKSGCFRIPGVGEKCLRGEARTEVADSNAIAISCPNEGAPGMRINTTSSDRRSIDRRVETLYHEMLHWLGYQHYTGNRGGVDVPYLASLCCFSRQARACDLLKASDPGACGLPRGNGMSCPLSPTSVEYAAQFTRLMSDDGRPSIGYGSTFAAGLRAPRVRRTDGRDYPDMSAVMKSAQIPSDNLGESRVARAAFGYASAGNVVDPRTGQFLDRASVESRFRSGYMDAAFTGRDRKIGEFSEHLGRLMGESVNGYGESATYRERLAAFQAVREEACASMGADDRAGISTIQQAYLVSPPPNAPSSLRCLIGYDRDPCASAAASCR